jgi:protein TonB
MTRRVEAGDYQDYSAFQGAITEHLLGLSKPGSGRLDRVIVDPPFVRDLRMPGALRIDHESVFWRSLRKTLQESPDREVSTGLYSVWCHGTHPDQKDLILKVASHAEAKITLKNQDWDPWNDPRFWIVVDWAMAWGSREDFEDIQKALPAGRQRSEFKRLVAKVERLPAFFSTPPPKPEAPRVSLKTASEPLADQDGSVEFSFTQIRIMDQPPAPRYPDEAKARRMMTRLILMVTVDPQGIPTSCRPVPGPWLGFFGPVGIEYGMRWRFHPAELNGVPHYARFRITMPFMLR